MTEYEPQRLLATFIKNSSQKNKTSESIQGYLKDLVPYEELKKTDEVPFSSARKFSAVSFGELTLALGAPEILLGKDSPVFSDIKNYTNESYRVVVFGKLEGKVPEDSQALQKAFKVLAIIAIEDPVRPEIVQTLADLAKYKIEFKIISGDAKETVAAVAKKINPSFIPSAITGQELAELDQAGFEGAALKNNIFSRIKPNQKQAIIRVLRSKGISTAMIGDGANDVLAIKESNLGIAMNGGSAMAKDVADIVLMNNSFAVLPLLLNESKKIVTNIQNIANIYLVKNISSILTILILGYLGLRFPFDPRHVELSGLLIIGLPSFILAFDSHSSENITGGFLKRLLSFAGIVGFVDAILSCAVYIYYELGDFNILYPKSMLVTTVILMGLYNLILIYLLHYPFKEVIKRKLVMGLVFGILFIYIGVLLITPLRTYFLIDQLNILDVILIFIVATFSFVINETLLKRFKLIG